MVSDTVTHQKTKIMCLILNQDLNTSRSNLDIVVVQFCISTVRSSVLLTVCHFYCQVFSSAYSLAFLLSDLQFCLLFILCFSPYFYMFHFIHVCTILATHSIIFLHALLLFWLFPSLVLLRVPTWLSVIFHNINCTF